MQSSINLLPVQHRPKPSVRAWPVILAIVLTLNLIAFATYWLTIQADLASSQNEMRSLQQDVNIIEAKVNDSEWKSQLATAVKTKNAYLTDRQNESILWHPMLVAFERAMVPGVVIKSLNTSAAGNISLAGETDSIASISDFLRSLQTETGLEIIRFQMAKPGEGFQISLVGWRGWEEPAEQEEQTGE